MSKEEESYISVQASKLSEITELPRDEILNVLENRVKEGYSPQGAVMMWKSEHKNLLGVGEARMFVGRVIGNTGKKAVRDWEVASVGMLIYDDGILETRDLNFWNETVPKAEMFKLGGVYEFKAFEKNDGTLTRIRAVKEVDEDKVPKIMELVAHDFIFKELKDLKKFVGENHLLHGWIGKVITGNRSDGGTILGFEFGDEESLAPVTCWGSGKYSAVPEGLDEVEAGDEIYAYGFIRIDGKGNPVVDGSGIFKV